ncbi:DUF2782 domain-containing protein [Oleiagrimonas soli]|uniref:DUF2782 domain-containing protein n=1 Tax=Oleiagrimonas soli TaxID=1543381 RepID=A0A099CYS1_9GAMM|nr:DUF2782 domain-containing protein [Oleiagrimonas soli]KGI78762.1 hypothetical protein LF63_0102060 [Oleiagrimonas soli]MBB6184474.1 hypothetical protein [Oleiagrimonas soli]
MSRHSTLLVLGAAALLAGASVQAQNASQRAPVPPPPGINDPGPQAAPASTATAPSSSKGGLRGLPELPAVGSDGAQRDLRDDPPPTVDVRTVGKDRVEEYRINGKLYMVHVIPAHGVPQTYMADSDGVLQRQAGQPPVKPVYYTIYQWGGPPKKKDGDGK